MSPSAFLWCWAVSRSWPASTSERYVPPEVTQRLWIRILTWVDPRAARERRSWSLRVPCTGFEASKSTQMRIDPGTALDRLVGTAIDSGSGTDTPRHPNIRPCTGHDT